MRMVERRGNYHLAVVSLHAVVCIVRDSQFSIFFGMVISLPSLGKPVHSWGASLMDSVLPKSKCYIQSVGVDVEENLNAW